MAYPDDLERAITEGKAERERVRQFRDSWEGMREGPALEILRAAAARLTAHGVESSAGNRNGHLFLRSGANELTFRFDEPTCAVVCTSLVRDKSTSEPYDYDSFGPAVIQAKAVRFAREVAALP